MVGWHHRLKGHECEQIGDSEGRGSLACCGPLGCKKRDTAECLNKQVGFLTPHSNSVPKANASLAYPSPGPGKKPTVSPAVEGVRRVLCKE